jgi:hypothetical protein
MQLVNQPALKALQLFLNKPSYEMLSRLTPIPCFYHLAVHQWTQDKQFSSELLVAFEWIAKRVDNVFRSSTPLDTPPLIEPGKVVDGGWKKVLVSIIITNSNWALTYFYRVVASIAYHRFGIDHNTQICQVTFRRSQGSEEDYVTSSMVNMVRTNSQEGSWLLGALTASAMDSILSRKVRGVMTFSLPSSHGGLKPPSM